MFTTAAIARVILTWSTPTLGARICAIDYPKFKQITGVLEKYEILTVISALGDYSENEHALIQASSRSNVTKRYIPSIGGIPPRARFLSERQR